MKKRKLVKSLGKQNKIKNETSRVKKDRGKA